MGTSCGQSRWWTAVWLVAIVTLWTTLLASPVSAHGENDARPIARDLAVGPYVVSLWQVIGDHGSGMSAHVIVDFQTDAPGEDDSVLLAVDGSAHAVLEASSSPTLEGVWLTSGSVDFGDEVRVGVGTGGREAWSEAVSVPSPPSDALPMGLIISGAALFTILVVMWLARRFRRAWRRTPRTQVAHESP